MNASRRRDDRPPRDAWPTYMMMMTFSEFSSPAHSLFNSSSLPLPDNSQEMSSSHLSNNPNISIEIDPAEKQDNGVIPAVNPAYSSTGEEDAPMPASTYMLPLRIDALSANKYQNGQLTPAQKSPATPGSSPATPGSPHSPMAFPEEKLEKEADDVMLLYTRRERVPMKDFAEEARAFVDVQKYLYEAQLLLDVGETNLSDILDKMLHQLLDKTEPHASVKEALKDVFTYHSSDHLSKTIQGVTYSPMHGYPDYDQAWMTILASIPRVQSTHVAIARLKHPANFGHSCEEVYFIMLVVAPVKQKGTKTALETGRTFATLFSDIELRGQLLQAKDEATFQKALWEYTQKLTQFQKLSSGLEKRPRKFSTPLAAELTAELTEADRAKVLEQTQKQSRCGRCFFGRDVLDDLKRRIPLYPADIKDGFVGNKTIQKTISTTLFLYFACLLPVIALGYVNDKNTHGFIGIKEVIVSQAVGGFLYAVFAGQPMVILLTTAPLAIYTKVIYDISDSQGYEFLPFYACTGLWNAFFLVVYSMVGLGRVMKWCTRSTEEIFSLFVSMAFLADAIKDIMKDFNENYSIEACDYQDKYRSGELPDFSSNQSSAELLNDTLMHVSECHREHSILYLLLTLCTVWLGLYLFTFTKTPFLNANKREILADYSLPAAVLFMSFIGSYVFRRVDLKPFNVNEGTLFRYTDLSTLPLSGVFVGMALGFGLSLLFFMDQNISQAMVNNPNNKLVKGPSYHWDLLVVGVLNGVLALFGMPMVHGALPHSPLHVRAMADMEDHVDGGHVSQEIIHVRETRVTPILSHILIGVSIFLLPYPLSYIPQAVLDGLFLYLAATALYSNELFERVTLLVTEQAAYPPNHYVRSVPQKKIHLFTSLQLLQLAALSALGFVPVAYCKMVFPVLLMILIPVRHKLLPLFIERKYLNAMDGH